MKKVIASVLVLGLVVALSSCGGGRHGACPAYGSVDAGSVDVEVQK